MKKKTDRLGTACAEAGFGYVREYVHKGFKRMFLKTLPPSVEKMIPTDKWVLIEQQIKQTDQNGKVHVPEQWFIDGEKIL